MLRAERGDADCRVGPHSPVGNGAGRPKW
jgi:hypothetical protein